MFAKWIVLLGLAAALSACANAPGTRSASAEPWNGGVWNSVLGYHGPNNVIVSGAP
jgi:hypothetical protein